MRRAATPRPPPQQQQQLLRPRRRGRRRGGGAQGLPVLTALALLGVLKLLLLLRPAHGAPGPRRRGGGAAAAAAAFVLPPDSRRRWAGRGGLPPPCHHRAPGMGGIGDAALLVGGGGMMENGGREDAPMGPVASGGAFQPAPAPPQAQAPPPAIMPAIMPQPSLALHPAQPSASSSRPTAGAGQPRQQQKQQRRKEDGGGGGGPRRTLVAYTKRIRACKPSQWRRALQILEDVEQPPIPPPGGKKGSSSPAQAQAAAVKPDLVLLNVAMDVLAKAGRWEECARLLRSLPGRGLKPDAISFNTAAHACARAGQVEGALGLMAGMAAAGVPPNARTLGAALDACRRAGQWEAALAVLGQMAPIAPALDEAEAASRAFGHVVPGVVHYSVVADACLAAGEVERAGLLLTEMTAVRGLRPDLVVYTSLAREEGRLGRAGRVTELVGEMEGGGIAPDERFFAAALEGAARGASGGAGASAEGVVGMVREVLALMKALGVTPSHAAHTSAVRALVGAGRAREAWHLFKKARAQGKPLDLRLYTAGLTALAREGRAAEARALVEEMTGDGRVGGGVGPDEVCHALVMEACCRAGRYAEAMTVLRGPLRMAGPEHAERLIRWLGEAGLWGEALRLLNEYEEEESQHEGGAEAGASVSSLAPSSSSSSQQGGGVTAAMYRGALRACALAGRGEEARALVAQMAARGHAITEAEPAAAMAALANGGRPLEAVELLAQLQQGEFAPLDVPAPGLACYNAALRAWATAGRTAEAVALLGHMYASPQAPAPDAASFNTALLACARKGDWRLALDLVRLMERLTNPSPSPNPGATAPRLLNTTTTAAGAAAAASAATNTDGKDDSPCSAPIAVGILGLQQHPLFVPSSPLSVPLLLSSSNAGDGRGGGGAAAPSLVTYNTLLQSLVKAQPPQPLLALGLFESLCASACPYLAPDAISFNLAIIAAGQAGQPQRALSLLRQMTHERGLAPSLQCLTSAIASLCHGATARGGSSGGKRPAPVAPPTPAAAASISGPTPDVSEEATATGAGVSAAAEARSLPPQQLLSQAEGLLREAEGLAAPLAPALDAAPYAALMAAHNRRGSPHRALRLYRRMRRRGVEPSASVLTQVLLACRRTMDAGGVYQALRLLRSKGWHLRPERGLYQAALTACYCEGDEEMGRGLREEALRLYGMEVGGEEEVVERAVKWGVALPSRSGSDASSSSSASASSGGRGGAGGASSSLRVSRRKK